MMTNADDRDPIATADRLERSVRGLTEEMAALRHRGRRNQHMIWGLVASLALDVILSVGFGFVAIQASSASHRASEATSASAQNRLNALVSCQSSNEARRVSRQMWTYVLDIVSQNNPTPTPEEARQVRTFRAYLATIYADRDCSNVTAPTPVPTPTPTR